MVGDAYPSNVSSAGFPTDLLAQAQATPGGWVYEIDPAYAPAGADGRVPPEGIKGAWKIGDDGQPTGEYRQNDNYRPPAG